MSLSVLSAQTVGALVTSGDGGSFEAPSVGDFFWPVIGGDSNWTLIANSASAGVVASERQAGGASIDLRNANFINENGGFNLQLQDGGGNAFIRTSKHIRTPAPVRPRGPRSGGLQTDASPPRKRGG